jgi:hypothetical protein
LAICYAYPSLLSFILKETLVLHQADAKILSTALSFTKSKKARLDVRMWNLHDSPTKDYRITVFRPNID